MSEHTGKSFKSPLGRARGLGSAKDGTHHWWAQRVTSLLLAPLVLWFVIALVSMSTADYGTVTSWLAQPAVAIATVLLLVATFYHAALGCQVIMEDYIGHEGVRLAGILLVNLLCLVLGAASVFSVLKLAFAG